VIALYFYRFNIAIGDLAFNKRFDLFGLHSSTHKIGADIAIQIDEVTGTMTGWHWFK
jgi:hypothetical protein